MRKHWWFIFALIMMIIAIGLVRAVWADGPVVKQSTCLASWDAPQTNTDGSNLNDLKEYRVYYAPGITVPANIAPFVILPAPELDPPSGRQGQWACRTLPLGQGALAVTAVDTAGNESARSNPFPFVLADDVAPLAPANLRVQ